MIGKMEKLLRGLTGVKLVGPPTALAVGVTLLSFNLGALAYDSGGTGVDGAFSPSVSTRLPLPEDGVFNFTTVDIPEGVTVTFEKNTTNTPVIILATGDVNVAGTIDVSGTDSADVGAAGDGAVGDDSIPGTGGPGGYDGGMGGPYETDYAGGSGLGPGGGDNGFDYLYPSNGRRYRTGGAGGGFGAPGSYSWNGVVVGGPAYGSEFLLPLIGGSGGGGGAGGNAFSGSGGGGGGGALLIAASGTINVTGSILANGGKSGASAGSPAGSPGGGGSGGAIRLIATTLAGNGIVSANGGVAGAQSGSGDVYYAIAGANGGAGRIRLEADILQRTAATTPAYTYGPPAGLFVAGLPSLRIASVADFAAPAIPTGVADIQLPADVQNPVTIQFEASGIPLGNIVELKVTPARGDSYTTVSNALDGNVDLSSATAQIDLPQGPSTLMATVTYTLVAALSEGLERFAGEPVERIRLEASLNGETRYVLLTKSGREVHISPAQLASAG
jgi:hypothetical protein